MIYNSFFDPSIDSHLCRLVIPMLGSWTCHWSSRPSKVLVSCGGQSSQNSMSFISICIPFRCVHPWGSYMQYIYIYININCGSRHKRWIKRQSLQALAGHSGIAYRPSSMLKDERGNLGHQHNAISHIITCSLQPWRCAASDFRWIWR